MRGPRKPNFKKTLIENTKNLDLTHEKEMFYLFDLPVDMHTIELWEKRLDHFGLKYALYDFETKAGHVGYNLRLERPFENNFLDFR